ncbi:MAG: AMP-binding protein, partial [Blastocatellia bacterium]
MNARANQLANYLRARGVGKESLVAIRLDRSLEMILAVIGVLKAGGAYIPIDPEYPIDRVKSMVEGVPMLALVTLERLSVRVSGLAAELIRLDRDWSAIAAESEQNLSIKVDPQNLAYVIYTSGSTGRPKGVMISHQAMNNLVLWMQEIFIIGGHDRLLQKTPFSFDPSVWEFFWPLITGAELVIARPGGHVESGYMVDLVIRRGITILQLVPSVLQLLVEEPGFSGCKSLRLVYCGAEALRQSLIDAFYASVDSKLNNVYGPTEAAMHVTFWPCESGRDRSVPIGRPAGNVQTYL